MPIDFGRVFWWCFSDIQTINNWFMFSCRYPLDIINRYDSGFISAAAHKVLLFYVSTKNEVGSMLAAKSFHLQKNKDGNCRDSKTLLFFEWLTFNDILGAIW